MWDDISRRNIQQWSAARKSSAWRAAVPRPPGSWLNELKPGLLTPLHNGALSIKENCRLRIFASPRQHVCAQFFPNFLRKSVAREFFSPVAVPGKINNRFHGSAQKSGQLRKSLSVMIANRV